MTGKEFIEIYKAKKNGCDKKCDKCALFIKDKKRCLYEEEKAWEKWNKERKKNV